MCFRQCELVRQVSESIVEALKFLGVVYGAEMDADWMDEAVWRAANPSLGDTASIDFYREQCARAQANADRAELFPHAASEPVGRSGHALHRHGQLGRILGEAVEARRGVWRARPVRNHRPDRVHVVG